MTIYCTGKVCCYRKLSYINFLFFFPPLILYFILFILFFIFIIFFLLYNINFQILKIIGYLTGYTNISYVGFSSVFWTQNAFL